MTEENPDIFTSEKRQQEQEWLQKRGEVSAPVPPPAKAAPVAENPLETLIEESPGSRDSEAQERIEQYEVLMPQLEPMLADTDARMEKIREEGIPNGAEYDALRKQLAGAFEPLMQLHQDIKAIADGIWEVSDTVRAKAREAKDKLEHTVERIEDIYQRSDAWLREHKSEVKNYGRRTTDYGTFKERRLSPELYDDQVVNLMSYVQKRIERAADMLIAAKKMEATDADELLGEIDKVHEQLLKLDERTEAPAASRERKALIGMLDRLRERLAEYRLPELEPEEEDPFAFALDAPLPPEPPRIEVKDLGDEYFIAEEQPKPGSLAAARAVYRQVRAQYAAVQHRLHEDHRRQAREKIARLKDMIRKAEHDEWARLFVPNVVEVPPAPADQPVPEELMQSALESDVQLVMARAATAAPVISTAVVQALKDQRPGLLASLGAAFRLK